MNKRSTLPIAEDLDEYPEATQADFDRATFRIGLKPAPLMQQITLDLDARLVAYFKAKAGSQGFDTIINETLREAILRDALEDSLRKIVREELQRGA